MTVTYTQEVATEKIGGFFRLLFRWRGSIYSVLYGEMIIFLSMYSALSFIYRKLLSKDQRSDFERICIYFERFADYIPVTFVVGFYVSRIIGRRWTQWENIPLPDRFAFNISSYLHGTDLKARMLRRTLVRYANLAGVLCFCDICVPVKKRFPSLDHLIVAGLMTQQEKELYDTTKSTKDSNWWIPFHWAYTLLYRVKQEGKLPEGFTRLQDDILDMRQKCWVLFSHDWIPIPMVYTQVATLSVYLFMFACVLGRQYLDTTKDYKDHNIDLYVPFFTIFQLTFYLGWLKVAEVLISPMGMDADDFEINYIIERNLKVSYSLVDYNYNKIPPLEKDVHWNEEEPEMPHTLASAGMKDQAFIGSAANVPVKEKDQRLSEMPLGVVSPQTSISRQPSVYSGPSGQVTRAPSVVWRSLARLVSRAPGDNLGASNNDVSMSPKLKRQSTIQDGDDGYTSPLIDQQKMSMSILSPSREAVGPRLQDISENSELLLDLASTDTDKATLIPQASPTNLRKRPPLSPAHSTEKPPGKKMSVFDDQTTKELPPS